MDLFGSIRSSCIPHENMPSSHQCNRKQDRTDRASENRAPLNRNT